MNSNRVSPQVASDQHDRVAFNCSPPVTPTASQQPYPTYMYGYLPTPIEPSVHQTPRIPFPGYPSHTAIPNPAAFISPTRAPLASTQPSPSKSHKRSYDEDITVQAKHVRKNGGMTTKGGALKKDGAKAHWSDTAKSQLFDRLLGPNWDETFDKLKQWKVPTLKKIAEELFPEKSANSVIGLWDCSFRTYKNICIFESVTGGGGDGDEATGVKFNESDSEEMQTHCRKLAKAKETGKDVGTLKAEDIEKWYSKGWFQLFDNRYHESPNVNRPIPRHSGSLLSDNEVADEDEEIDQLDEMSAFGDDLVIQETQPHDDDDFELDDGEWPPSPGCPTLDNDESGCYDAPPSPTYVHTEPLPTIPIPPMSSAPQSSTKLKKPPSKVSKKNSGVSVATASSELLTKQSGYLDEHIAQSKIQLVLLRDKEK
ncbi:hypothetical protein C8J55DRAFT_558618 [Lentinula edodes]|uniref:Uncharacterized protein n=1 Tax=Lentinula lateritia TaxID=40482 RepID=A0A9W9DTY8_9AGAR|nr:hypothetical protein C8J55DRAFT_558618 [Lentinula edodes]